MKKAVWLSFDLGLKGDYPGFYAWLDNNNAKECGDSVAFIQTSTNKLEELQEDIQKSITIDNNTRIYVIFMGTTNDGKSRIRGRFLFGNRRSSPWQGYGLKKGEVEDRSESV